MNSEFIEAINTLATEREIQKDVLIEAIEVALVSAYRKNYGNMQNVHVNVDKETGDVNVYMHRDVVAEVQDAAYEISLEEAKEIDPAYEIGDSVEYQVMPKDFGRIAAQTAKQVVLQRIRDAEKQKIYDEFVGKCGELVAGSVSRLSNQTVFVDLGQTEAIILPPEKIPGEVYFVGKKIRAYVVDVKRISKGPQVYLSRSHPGMVKRLLELEVPEIADGTIQILALARDAGLRTKVLVESQDEYVGALGACLGHKGVRVKAIMDEIDDEKVDIVEWNTDTEVLIKNALAPAKVDEVVLDWENKIALVVVPESQQTLAIGTGGQNARLAAKITGWKIDIKNRRVYKAMLQAQEEAEAEAEFEGEPEVVVAEVEESPEDWS